MNVLLIIKLLVALLPEIFSAIHNAERILGASKGADKLAHAVDAVSKVLPADDVEHATAVKDLLPIAISAAVGLMNKKGELPKAPAAADIPQSLGGA